MNIYKLSIFEFAEKAVEYNRAHRIKLDIKKPTDCPVHVYSRTFSHPSHTTVPNTKTCPLCRNYVCPTCGSHDVDVLSRVTGYIQAVSGWNEGKKQELKDRKRVSVGR